MTCVDRTTNRVAPDSLCAAAERLAGGSGNAGGGSGGGYYGAGYHPSPFLWYYGGRVLNGYMSAGSYSPLSGYRYRSPGGYTYDRPSSGGGFFGRGGGRSSTSAPAAPGAVSRGGFGATGAGHASAS